MLANILAWLWLLAAAAFVVVFFVVARRGKAPTVGRRMLFGYSLFLILLIPFQHSPTTYVYAIASVFGLLTLFGGVFKKSASADTPLFEPKLTGKHANNEDPS